MSITKWGLLVGCLMLPLGSTACARSSVQKVPMTVSSEIPAAEGTVKTSRTDNDNTAIDLEVRHLAPPDRVKQGATTYVVWARPSGTDKVQNLGALQVDDNLDGKLETVTPLRRFEVFITAESDPAASSPSGKELLSTSVERLHRETSSGPLGL